MGDRCLVAVAHDGDQIIQEVSVIVELFPDGAVALGWLLDEMAAGVTAWRGEVQSVVDHALSPRGGYANTNADADADTEGDEWDGMGEGYQANRQTNMEEDRLLTSMGPRSSRVEAGCEFELEILGRGRCRWLPCRLSSLLESGER